MARTIVATWRGAYLCDGRTVLEERLASTDVEALAEAMRRRRAGRTTAEEERLLAARPAAEVWSTRDRRLARDGVLYDPTAPGAAGGTAGEEAPLRAAFLRAADLALRDAWDPSVHVEEAVRALRDLDRALNLLGERVASWASRDFPDLEGEGPRPAAKAILERSGSEEFSPKDDTLASARRKLAELWLALGEAREAVDAAVRSSTPHRAPNLDRLLGPELTARLVAQAGGLDRLAHLPASTVQVLGAEKAFFEHLRGRAPPPRHGLLFLHPSVQGAPRAQRGKLARALAAKVAIAARLDRAGAGVRPGLAEAFEARRAAIRTAGPGPRSRRRRSVPPLHGATDHR